LIFVARPNGHTHRMIQRILEVKDRDSAHPLPEELKNYLGENWKAVRDEIVDALTPIVTAERGSEDRGIFVEKNCAFVPGRGVLLNDETPGDGGEEESRDEFAHVPGYGACALMETIESVLHTEYHRSDHLRATIVYGSHDLAKTVSPTKVVFPSEKKKKVAVLLLRHSNELGGRDASKWESLYERAWELLLAAGTRGNQYEKIVVVFADNVKGTEAVPIVPGGRIRYAVKGENDGLPRLVFKAWRPEGIDDRGRAVDEEPAGIVDACPLTGAFLNIFPDGSHPDFYVSSLSRICMPGALDWIRVRGYRLFSWDLWLADEYMPVNLKVIHDNLSVKLDDPRIARLIRTAAFGDFLWRLLTANRLGFWR